MADIRKRTGVLDDFNRADEAPLSGGGNWARSDLSTFGALELLSNQVSHPAAGVSGDSYWTPTTYDGDDAEVWAQGSFTAAAAGLAVAVGLWVGVGGSGTVDGYRLRIETTSTGRTMVLYEFLNGSGSERDSDSLSAFSNQYILLRRNGNDVEGWLADAGDLNTWTQHVGVTDTTYMTGFSLAAGIRDNGGNQRARIDNFGGGPSVSNGRPQFMRRPWAVANP